MRKLSYNLAIALSLLVMLGSALTANAADKDKRNKIPKHMGVLSVYTLPEPAPVKINGEVLGMSTSDKGNPAEFVLKPGRYTVEIGFGEKTYTTEVVINEGERECVCVKKIVKRIDYPCPYDMRVDVPAEYEQGDQVVFTAVNMAGGNPPLHYVWKVSPETATFTGQGTNSISVDSAGLGGSTISASVDVNQEGLANDALCRQMNSADTAIKPPVVPPSNPPLRVDEFESVSFDDDKARFDNFAIQLLSHPDAQGYIIVYQGTAKNAQSAERASRRALNYLTKNKGIDPRRISITSGGYRAKTGFEIWIIPAGAEYPAPRPTASR